MITVVTFKWFDPRGRYNRRYLYTADMVNSLFYQVRKNLTLPHKFVCITDDTTDVDPKIPCAPISNAALLLGYRYPKLSIFDPEMQNRIKGDRFLCLDLDCIITGNIDKYVTRDYFRIWSNTSTRCLYNSSMMLFERHAYSFLWSNLTRDDAYRVAPKPDVFGSDQMWIQYNLGTDELTWTSKDGVLSFYRDVDKKGYLPDHARIVFFNGGHNPYSETVQTRHPWIKQCLQ